MSEQTGPAAVAGIVLAAGHAERMGHNKLLLDIDGEPLVRRAVRQAIEAGLSPVLVVLGFEAERVRRALAGLRFEEVLNPEHARGINGSIRRGIARVPGDHPAAVVSLADMPFVTSAMLARLVSRYRETGAPLVLSLYGGVQAPPTLYGRPLFAEFDGPEGEGIGKRIVGRHRHEAARVDWPPDALADIDAPADYARIQARVVGATTPEEGD